MTKKTKKTAKKTTKKTTSKIVKSTVKKTSKKSASKAKKSTKIKDTPIKAKLGHDPLAWITGEDAEELGISFDDIDKNSSSTIEELDAVLPATTDVSVADSSTESIIGDNSVADAEPIESDEPENQGWGLFEEASPSVVDEQPETVSDDGSWGLFGDEMEATDSVSQNIDNPDEGVAWGLFSDETVDVSDVEQNAIVINLPASFTVSEINAIYHEIDLKIHESNDIILDAKNVDAIDATGLQLLYSVQKELEKNNCKLAIRDSSSNIESLSKSSFLKDIVGVSG